MLLSVTGIGYEKSSIVCDKANRGINRSMYSSFFIFTVGN